MAKTSKNGRERKRAIVMLRLIVDKLQKGLSVSPSRRLALEDNEFDKEAGAATTVPEDVKEGHFAVFAVEGGEPKRFVIELGYLTNPALLRLLELAEEEFGFKQGGALAVCCQPDELQRILGGRRKDGSRGHSATCKTIMIESY